MPRVSPATELDRPGDQTVPSGGFSARDNEPLSSLQTPAPTSPVIPSRPRKKRRLIGRPRKVMKEAYFEGIQWTRTFVTGPLDPDHNKYKF